MAGEIDVIVEKNSNAINDIQFENGDFKRTSGFDTALLLSIFCEKRADVSQQPIEELRRGWIGNLVNEFENYEQGSHLWLILEQSRLTQKEINLASIFSRQALQWLIDDGHLKDIKTSAFRDGNSLKLEIELIRNSGVTETKYFTLWEQTGINQD